MFADQIDFQSSSRRQALRLGAMGALGAMLSPAMARAASADPMANVTQFMERWVGPGKFPGLVTTLGLPGQPTQFAVRGAEGFADADAMTPDSLFRIYSMTKPITGMAAMMLVDEGRLGLDQPLSRHSAAYLRKCRCRSPPMARSPNCARRKTRS